MWTNNGKKILAGYTFEVPNSEAPTLTFMNGGTYTYKAFYGTTATPSSEALLSYSTYNSNNNPSLEAGTMGTGSGGIGIFVGTGTTEPTAEDTTLENLVPMTLPQLTSSLSIQSSGTTTTISFNLINSSGSEQTITEIGLACQCMYQSQKSWWVLMNRKLLPEPVTMGVNEVYTFTYQLDWASLTD